MNKTIKQVKQFKHRSRVPLDIKIMEKETGAMAMSMIFKYYLLYLDREKAGIEAGVTVNGTTSERLLEGFKRNGFDATLHRKLTVDELDGLVLPAVARWKDDRFCVITKVKGNTIHLNDPETGRLRMCREEFAKHFSGELIEALPNESFQPGGERTGLLSFIKEWLGNDKTKIAYIFVFGLILIIPNIIFPASYKVFLDNVLGLRQDYLFRPMILALVLLMIFTAVTTYVQWRLITRLEIKLALINSANFFRHLLRLPLPFFFGRYAGELGKRIPLNANMAMIFAVDLPKTIINLVSILLYALVMLNYNVVLTIVGVAFSLINLWALKVITAKREALNQTIVQNQGKVYSESMVGLQIIETIKAAGAENDFFAHWAAFQTKFVNNDQKLGYANRFLDVLPKFLKNLNNIILICMGALLVIHNSMTIGLLVAFQALMDTFTKPVSDIINNGGKFQDAAAAITTLKDAVEVREDESFSSVRNPEHLQVTPANAKLRGELELRNLVFGYDKYKEPLITGFSMRLEPGASVALVGASGSGKSTLAKIVMGVLRPWEGEVLFDGKPASEYPRVIMANSVSMVDQHIFLFSGTVDENITMWNKSIPRERIIAAARDACIDEVIHERPGGFQSHVEEGGKNFSGGQQQRLEIARALVNNPSLLILDEATSALDPHTEQRIMANLRRRACTTFIIAHRLSTIRDSDLIVVLDQGKVVQQGTHEELLKDREGHYFKLVKLS